MNAQWWFWQPRIAGGAIGAVVLITGSLIPIVTRTATASSPCDRCGQQFLYTGDASARCCEPVYGEWAGNWYWLRSPEQEQRVVASLYNRYCIRCHGVDGRGVWDIPDVPDFTNERWQASRSDGQLSRLILEGRGAVMPPFRGTLSLEEAWAMARYLRSFVPGSEVSRPDFRQPDQDKGKPQAHVQPHLEAMPIVAPASPPGPTSRDRTGFFVQPHETRMSR